VLLVIGIAAIAVGISDYAIAGLLARNRAAGAPGGLGDSAAPPAASRVLKLTGATTVLAGVVLVALALAT
jgi:hypothetical protein